MSQKFFVFKNGNREYINVDADNVKFTDGDTFQEKLNKDLLRGG